MKEKVGLSGDDAGIFTTIRNSQVVIGGNFGQADSFDRSKSEATPHVA